MIGGYWASGLPHLKSTLKSNWDPSKADPESLAGIQLALLKVDSSRLKVILYCWSSHWQHASQHIH